MALDIDELTLKVEEYTKSVISEKRFQHSKRTAETLKQLCEIYGLDTRKGYLAGIAHDMCKEISPEEMMNLALQDGREISDVEKNHVSLLHGRAASVRLEQMFDIHDSDILDAVSWHTFGYPGLCDLGKLLFVADKVEPARPQSTEEYRARLFSKSLNDLTLSVLIENIEYLEKHGKIAADVTFRLRDELLEKK